VCIEKSSGFATVNKYAVYSIMKRFESILLTPATILGTPDEAGLNQKNSTSLALGTQTAFDFYPPTFSCGLIRHRSLAGKRPAAAGVLIPKCSMAVAKSFQTFG
jgi:hypothetical protein